VLHAVLLAALGEGVLTLMDALIKGATARLSTVEIAFLRFAAGSIWAIGLAAIVRPGWPSKETLAANGLRAVIVVATATLFFYALSKLPLADAIALAFIGPIFIALLGALILRERLDARILVGLAFGFVGMVVIVGHGLDIARYSYDSWLGAGAVLLSAFLYATSIVLLRARALRDPLVTIVLIQNVGPALILLPVMLVLGRWPDKADALLFAGIGLLGVAGHMSLAFAFSRAEAARLAPVTYTTLVWAMLFGWLLLGDVPGATTLVGAMVIVLGSFVVRKGR
jgi:drug/metabolite transporter (DMT)-like permease